MMTKPIPPRLSHVVRNVIIILMVIAMIVAASFTIDRVRAGIVSIPVGIMAFLVFVLGCLISVILGVAVATEWLYRRGHR